MARKTAKCRRDDSDRRKWLCIPCSSWCCCCPRRCGNVRPTFG